MTVTPAGTSSSTDVVVTCPSVGTRTVYRSTTPACDSRGSTVTCASTTAPAAIAHEMMMAARMVRVLTLMNMAGGCGRRRRIATLEEPLFLNLLPNLRRRPRIHRFHLLDLVGRQTWQLPNEVHEVPRLLRAFRRPGAPGRHAREANTVLADVVQLGIGQCFRSI